MNLGLESVWPDPNLPVHQGIQTGCFGSGHAGLAWFCVFLKYLQPGKGVTR